MRQSVQCAVLSEGHERPARLDHTSVTIALALPNPQSVVRVLHMLMDASPPVPPRILAPLVAHPALEVRLTTVAVLTHWSDDESRELLGQFLGDRSPRVRDQVVAALDHGGRGLPPSTGAAALYQEDDPDRARRLAELMVRHDPPGAVRVLQRAVAALVSGHRSAAVLRELLGVLRQVDAAVWHRFVRHLRGHSKKEYATIGVAAEE